MWICSLTNFENYNRNLMTIKTERNKQTKETDKNGRKKMLYKRCYSISEFS
jgi:hypothetical protein